MVISNSRILHVKSRTPCPDKLFEATLNKFTGRTMTKGQQSPKLYMLHKKFQILDSRITHNAEGLISKHNVVS